LGAYGTKPQNNVRRAFVIKKIMHPTVMIHMVVTMTLMTMVIIVKYAPKVIVVPLVTPNHNHVLRVIIAH
jgi:hypothetical protein